MSTHSPHAKALPEARYRAFAVSAAVGFIASRNVEEPLLARPLIASFWLAVLRTDTACGLVRSTPVSLAQREACFHRERRPPARSKDDRLFAAFASLLTERAIQECHRRAIGVRTRTPHMSWLPVHKRSICARF